MDIKNYTTVTRKPNWIKALIYGQAGAGKTRFCADAPQVFYFDWENSTETLRHWPDYNAIRVKKPETIEEFKRDVLKAIDDPDIDTIVLDSITSALDFYMHSYMEKQNRDPNVIYEADWKYATAVFGGLFTLLSNADIHVVIIGHARTERNTDTGTITATYPDVTPRLRQNLARLVNVVGYMEVVPSKIKERTRRLYLNPTPIIEAKNRLNIQETFFENPTWKQVFDD